MADTEQAVEQQQTQAQSVELPEAPEGEDAAAGTGTGIDILLDINVAVTVTVGKRDIPLQRLLQLGPGSVLKLDKPIDAPADIYVRDTKFATGTVVVINNRFAVRIKEIIGTGAVADQTEE